MEWNAVRTGPKDASGEYLPEGPTWTGYIELLQQGGVNGTGPFRIDQAGNVTTSGIINVAGGSDTAASAPVLTAVAGTNGGAAVQLTDTTRDYNVYLQVGTAGTAWIVSMGHTSSGNDVTLHASGVATAGQVLTFRLPAGWYFLWSATTATLAQSVAVGC
jgi:hypothetical protein